VLFFFCGNYELKLKIKIFAVFIITTLAIATIFFCGLSAISRRSLVAEFVFFFNYASKTRIYVPSLNPFVNFWLFLKLLPRLFFEKYGAIPIYLIVITTALFFIKNLRLLVVDNFFRFICIYTIVNLLFFSYWDTRENLKLKIIFIQLFFISVNYLVIKSNVIASKLAVTLIALIICAMFLINFYTVMFNSNLDNIADYKFTEQLHNFAPDNKIAIRNLSNLKIKFIALTYFNKEVEFLNENDIDYTQKSEYYLKSGYRIITAR